MSTAARTFAVPEEQRPTLSRIRRELETRLGMGQPIRITGVEDPLPPEFVELLKAAMLELATNRRVTMVETGAELTTQDAANLLGFSRPYLVRLLTEGRLPFYEVGNRRRLRLEDVLAFRRQRSLDRQMGLREMADEADELGLYGARSSDLALTAR